MEKAYLRNDKARLRPLPMLMKWLQCLRLLSERKLKPWEYISDQLRAVRQELLVLGAETRTLQLAYALSWGLALHHEDLIEFRGSLHLDWRLLMDDSAIEASGTAALVVLASLEFPNPTEAKLGRNRGHLVGAGNAC